MAHGQMIADKQSKRSHFAKMKSQTVGEATVGVSRLRWSEDAGFATIRARLLGGSVVSFVAGNDMWFERRVCTLVV
jgi:hypothetical protein